MTANPNLDTYMSHLYGLAIGALNATVALDNVSSTNDEFSLGVITATANVAALMSTGKFYCPVPGRLGLHCQIKNRTASTSSVEFGVAVDGGAITWAAAESHATNVVNDHGVSVGPTVMTRGFHTVQLYMRATIAGTYQVMNVLQTFTESAQ